MAQNADLSFDETALREEARKTLKNNVAPFVKKYCISCHGGYAQAGVNLQSALDSPESATSFLHWQKAVANVKVHDMPPEDSGEIPTDEERQEFVRWIGKLKYMAERDPGPFVMRRLSKVEYRNTLRDLYGIDPSLADSLPEEVVGEGYLNSISPMQSELFFDIANKVIAQVLPYDGLPVRRNLPTSDAYDGLPVRRNQTGDAYDGLLVRRNQTGDNEENIDGQDVRRTVGQSSDGQDVRRTAELQKLFGDTPSDEGDYRSAARQVARTLARDAYRRPPTDAELDVLVGIFDLGRENELSYTASLALMWKAVLVSPQFLFMTPVPYDGVPVRRESSNMDGLEARPTSDIQPLDDYQLASRLSYLLWSSPPDSELSALADNGQLHKPEVLRAQVERLLQDERSRALFDSFGAQWLGVSGLQSQTFDPEVFPQMTADLRTAMMDEARLFFDSIIQESQSVSRLVDTDYTFLNEPLATLYGLEQSIEGPTMQRIKLEDPNRGGILSMPAILAATSLPNRTSPVKRGVWVLEQVLGERVPPPPPRVSAFNL